MPLQARIARWLFSHPKTLILFLLGLLALSLSALPRFTFISGLEPFFDRSIPEQKVLDAVKARFVSDEVLLVGYRCDDLFSRPCLTSVRALGERIAAIKVLGPDGAFSPVARVDSLLTLKDLRGSDLSFKSEPLVPDPIPEGSDALVAIRERAFNNPLLRTHFLSSDGTTAALVVRLVPTLTDAQGAAAADQVSALLEEVRAQGVWAEQMFTGKRALVRAISQAMARDNARFIPLTLAMMVVVLLWSVRRLAGVILVLVDMILCLVVGLALMPLLHISMTTMCSILTPLGMMLACATAVHFLSEYGQTAKETPGPDVGERTTAHLLVPSTMCAFSTLVGFAAVGVSNIPAQRDFAIVSALLVAVVFVVTFVLMVLAAKWRPAQFWIGERAFVTAPWLERATRAYTELVVRRPLPILATTVALFVLAVAGLPRLVVDSNILEDVGRSDLPIRRETLSLEERLGGIESLVLSIRSDKEGAFLDPANLHRLDELERFLLDEASMDRVVSFTGFVKLMHRGFFSEDPKEFRVPDTREAVAQLLLLNGDSRVDEYVDPTRSWVRVAARYHEHSLLKQWQLFAKARTYLEQKFPASEGFRADVTGDSLIRVITSRRLLASQTTGLGLAFVIIFAPIFLLLRSIRAGLFSIPSNLFPIVVVLGVMGWFAIPVNTYTSVIASIVLGMVVDDSIHFLQSFREQLREGATPAEALRATLRAKGAAVLVSTLVFVGGFSVLLVSQFPPVAWFGVLTALTMLVGLLGELLVLPPLLVLFGASLARSRSQRPVAPVHNVPLEDSTLR